MDLVWGTRNLNTVSYRTILFCVFFLGPRSVPCVLNPWLGQHRDHIVDDPDQDARETTRPAESQIHEIG